MKLKTIEVEGKAYGLLDNGNPVYVHDDGKEAGFDAAHTVQTISRLNGEAKSHRQAKEEAVSALKKFEGIEDATTALKALETVKNLDDKKLIDAGEVERVKAEITKVFDEKLAAANKRGDVAESALKSEKIGGSFSRSKFITEKIAVPSDMIEAQFGKNFSIDDGGVVAKDASGNLIYSKTNAGSLANFEEAIEILVDQYPYKDNILKGTGSSGGGTTQANGGGDGSKIISREKWDALPHQDRTAKMRDGFTVEA